MLCADPCSALLAQTDSSSTQRDVKYVSQMYTGGEPCDITGATRETEVQIQCTGDHVAHAKLHAAMFEHRRAIGPLRLWREPK